MKTIALPNEELLPEIAELLADGNQVIIKANGNSMLPFIVGGRDSVVLQKKDLYAVGDIVLAEVKPKCFVLHRVINTDYEKLTLMGDGNISATEICRKENIAGHAISIIRKGKNIDCNNLCEKRKARLWQRLLPVRRYLLAIYRRTIL